MLQIVFQMPQRPVFRPSKGREKITTFLALQVFVLQHREPLNDEPLRVVVRANGIDKLTGGDKAPFGDITFADDLRRA